MAKEQLNESNYVNPQGAFSKAAKKNWSSRLTSLFGWNLKKDANDESKIVFLKKDLENRLDRYNKVNNPLVNEKNMISEKLDDLFSRYLNDTSSSVKDLQDRTRRINELEYMMLNDPFISRVVGLVADEAVQLDEQEVLVDVESPNPLIKLRIHQLIQKWGITPNRVRAACLDIELYGEAVWSNKITQQGVEKIVPLRVTQIKERLEFSPIHAIDRLEAMRGYTDAMNRDSKLQNLIDYIDKNSEIEDLADFFDTKLFGFALGDDLVAPPWCITHFRHNVDSSVFFPYGRPHLINALAPFKQAMSTMTLQSLARIMSFPVQIFKVKTSPGMDEASQWEAVNKAREFYEQIGVTPTNGSAEVFSVNTKMWMPNDLVELVVQSAQVDIDFVADLEMYVDRVAQASGVPKGYLVQEWGGWGNSALSLIEQNKPFARHVYSIQSTFLEGLTDLIRLHFSITGEFAIEEQFTLSMKFPAIEMSDEKNTSRSASLDLADSVLTMIANATGASDAAHLPLDVVRDVISKFSFLKPEDIAAWIAQRVPEEEMSSGGEGEIGGERGGERGGGFSETPEEDIGAAIGEGEGGLAEGDITEALSKAKLEKRLQEKKITERYFTYREKILFDVLSKKSITEWSSQKRHYKVSSINESLRPMYEILSPKSSKKLQEAKENEYKVNGMTITDILQEMSSQNEDTVGGRVI